MRLLEAAVEGQLLRPVGEQQPLGAGGLEGLHRFLGRQMTSRLPVQLSALEGRLAEEQVDALRETWGIWRETPVF